MRKDPVFLLIIASVLILAATACSSKATDERQTGTGNAIVRESNAIAALQEQGSLADCELQVGGTQPLESWAKTPEEAESLYEWTLGNTVSQPLDPDTATLEQILERSRLAMGDIVTYKSCGTSVDRESVSQEFSDSTHNFSVFHSYDH